MFKTKAFFRSMKKSGLSDSDLLAAVDEMERGLVDADLGQDVYKKRVATGSRGKSSGARTIVATRHAGHWFFMFGFLKGERSNITKAELKALQEVARELLALGKAEIDAAKDSGEILEVNHDNA